MASNEYIIAEDSLECPICYENSINKDPRMLPCQHTICFECLQKYVNGCTKPVLTCPECRQEFQLPNGDVNKVMKNIIYSKIIGPKCNESDICGEHNKEGSLFCVSHNIGNICIDCFHDNHLQCNISTMKNRRELLNSLWDRQDDKKNVVFNEISTKQGEIIKNIELKFLEIKNQVIEKLTERKRIIKEMFENDKPYDENFKKIENFIEKTSFEIEIEDLNVNYIVKDNSKYVKKNDDSIKAYFNSLRTIGVDRWNGQENALINESYVKIGTKSENSKFETKMYRTCDINFDKFFTNLSFFKNLRRLQMNFIIISDKDFGNVCESLNGVSDNLNELNFNSCELNEQKCFHLQKLLENCRLLINFSVYSNRNMKNGVSSLCIGLRRSIKILRSLNFNSCNLSQGMMIVIGEMLRFCINLENFEMAYNSPTEITFDKICEGLFSCKKTLKKLNFRSCELKENYSIYLSQTLTECPLISEFDISLNPNFLNGKPYIPDALRSSCLHLKLLNLFGCNVSQSDCQNFGKLFEVCNSLQAINLCKNPSMKNGLIFILKRLKTSSNSLRQLHFDSEHLVENQWNSAEKLLSNCKNMIKLLISYNENEHDESFLSNFCETTLNSSDSVFEIKLVRSKRLEIEEMWFELFQRVIKF